jgi:hypothetical protein
MLQRDQVVRSPWRCKKYCVSAFLQVKATPSHLRISYDRSCHLSAIDLASNKKTTEETSMGTTNDQSRNQESKRAEIKSDLLKELTQIQERVALAGFVEARHFLAVAAMALEDATNREVPTMLPPEVAACPD